MTTIFLDAVTPTGTLFVRVVYYANKGLKNRTIMWLCLS